ncbi:MAG: endonuclease/exonuclease/phosphatase family protein [Rhodocyclaceae bacterium]|nr:endonuclease/exonuclease/phosphatase family protein [Rhodocyclaceae bacterium]
MRILSWNIQWGRGADGRVDLHRTIARIQACGPLDAICLQELALDWPGLAGQASPIDGPAVFAAAFPQHMALYAPALERGDGANGCRSFGNLMLVAGPVGQIWRRPLPAPADPAVRSMQRVCLEVVLERPGGDLRVLTTHLEYYSVLQRRAQVAALRDWQREIAAEGVQQRPARADSLFGGPRRPPAAVLCGDFNFAPEAPEMATLTAADDGQAVWSDAWRIVHGGVAHAPSVGLHGADWPDHPYCCDYFFVSDELAARLRHIEVLSDTAASDHQPLLLELDA